MHCADVQKFVHAYIDGEFADSDRVEFDAHLLTCTDCRDLCRLQARFKAAIRESFDREREHAPMALRARIASSLAGSAPPRPRWLRLGLHGAPLAAAAALLLLFFWPGSQPRLTTEPPPAPSLAATSPIAVESIANFQRDLPIEVRGPSADSVHSWFRGKLDFPVKPLPLQQANLVGGRLINVGPRQAAMLVYAVGGSKVSVLVFDPREMPLAAGRRLRVGGQDVYLQGERGYNVALFRHRGLGYVLTSDLDEGEMLKLVSTAIGR